MADSRSPESSTPGGPRPGARPFVRPGSGPRAALNRPAITPSRLTRPPFRAILPTRPATGTPAAVQRTVSEPVAAITTVQASPEAVLAHVAGSQPSPAELETAEIAMLGDDVGEGLTLTATGASEVLMAEALGQREDVASAEARGEAALPAGMSGDVSTDVEAPAVQPTRDDPARSSEHDERVHESATSAAASDASDPEWSTPEVVPAAPEPIVARENLDEDPFVVAARAPVAESDWWSFHHDAAHVAGVASAEQGTPGPMIGGSPNVVRVAAVLEVLANRVRAGEIAVDAVPVDAGDAATLAGLLTSLLTRSSA